MNGRYAAINDIGLKIETVNGKQYPIPYLSFKLPSNSGENSGVLDIKFRKYKVCDGQGNAAEAWFLSTDTFPLAS